MLLGMSQEKLGEQLGLTFQQVQKYEKGINRIGASRLFDLAQVLGVPVQFFYEEAPVGGAARSSCRRLRRDARPRATIVEFLRSRDGLELNKAFVRITDAKVRRAIVDLVRSLRQRRHRRQRRWLTDRRWRAQRQPQCAGAPRCALRPAGTSSS